LRSQIIELEKIEKLRDHFNATWNKIEQNIEKKVEIHQKIKKIQKSNKKRQQN
jgi:lysozyme family protein